MAPFDVEALIAICGIWYKNDLHMFCFLHEVHDGENIVDGDICVSLLSRTDLNRTEQS